MDNVILIRYGELYLKGKNKCVFENKLIANIKAKLSGIACDLHFGRGRYVVKNYAIGDEAEIIVYRGSLVSSGFGRYTVQFEKSPTAFAAVARQKSA